jgi:ubiquinone/menaquinone biosynthesis C-methylase UbiE
MSDETAASDPAADRQREQYSQGGNAAAEAMYAHRSAAAEAAFFLPHLQSGTRLLDCGSGPGSLTCDLAEVVAPGEVVGLDLQPAQVERAQTLAGERGITNVRFETGSVYALPFADATFDAALAHTVLMHLRDPLAALREMRRVLKPGGIVGLRDVNFSQQQFSPPTPLLDEMVTLHLRVMQHNGASPFYAGHQRQLLLAAGFARSEAIAAFSYDGGAGSLEKTRQAAAYRIALIRGPAISETALAQGWVDQAGLDEMCAELEAWGERPDALMLVTYCMAVGWNAA